MSTDDFFGGAPSLSWSRQDANGEWVDVPELLNVVRGGKVTAIGEPVQMTEFGTGKPLWWKTPEEDPTGKGQPKMQIIISLICDGSGRGIDERDRSNPSDLGERRLFVSSKDMREAIGAACRKVGLRGVRVGGELYVAWTGKRPNKRQGGGKPARTWASLFVAPVVEAVMDDGPFQGAGQAGQPAVTTDVFSQRPDGQVPAAAAPAQQPAAVPPWERPPTSSPFGN